MYHMMIHFSKLKRFIAYICAPFCFINSKWWLWCPSDKFRWTPKGFLCSRCAHSLAELWKERNGVVYSLPSGWELNWKIKIYKYWIYSYKVQWLMNFHSDVGSFSINVHSPILASILTLGIRIEYYVSLSEGDTVCCGREQSFILWENYF